MGQGSRQTPSRRGAGLIFKGSGFYITDYRSEGYKAAAKKESGGGSGPSEKKSDSKPATSSESKSPSKPKKTDG